ncbi:MAG: Rpn family recombination-promoting nuclease/putative transposase [Lachnospiraceae bacterium]|nr:Rpn family recombination-promoting nuclease/putative transposase [Lachnospiraceae bacterium]
MTETKVKRNYKDSLFLMLFKNKENLLSLYNAVNGTQYTNTDDIEITTLENAIYMSYKNDISFVFDFELMLYEHQSTINPNMPLRDLFYVTKVLQGLVRNEHLYNASIIKLPTPRFIVFYNGTKKYPQKQILKLSDAYEKKIDLPELELIVTIYNINIGNNAELLNTCQVLKEYAQYVELVRKYARELPIAEAVEKAVDFCIENEILADFLKKNRAEAIEVSIYEYDEEEHMKLEREFGYKEGIKEGENRLVKLLQCITADKRDKETNRILADAEYREKLYKEYKI